MCHKMSVVWIRKFNIVRVATRQGKENFLEVRELSGNFTKMSGNFEPSVINVRTLIVLLDVQHDNLVFNSHWN